MRRILPFVTVLVLSVPAFAQTVPSGFTVDSCGGSLTGGTAMAFTPDGRLLVSQQTGAVRIIKAGVVLATPFHTATVENPLGGERELLGIAVDPGFAGNGSVYVHHTAPTPSPHNGVRRLTASPSSSDVSDGTETVIVDLEDLGSSSSHNGGGMAFGSDGKLHVGVGDNVNAANAQSITSRPACREPRSSSCWAPRARWISRSAPTGRSTT